MLNFHEKNPREAEKKEAIYSIVINLIVFIMRFFAGISIGSSALITDAFHGLSDSITSLGVLVSSKIASKPADEDHPLGHGKAADLGSLFIGIMLIGLGGVFIWEGFRSLISPAPLKVVFIVEALTITLITVGIKIYNYYIALILGKSSGSSLCLADALHHKMDAYITLGAAVGVTINWFTGISRIDGALTILISAIILYEGAELMGKVSQLLMDRNIEDIAARVKEIALSVQGVKNVGEVIVRESGGDLLVSMTVEIDGKTTLSEAHSIADKIETEIKKKIPKVVRVHIHEEPMV
ncbi:MAG: cation diffusion facilitator family transporter [Fervidicoccaceae archaeon]